MPDVEPVLPWIKPGWTGVEHQEGQAVIEEALEKIAELEGDCANQQFKLTRFQAAQVARKALHELRQGDPMGDLIQANRDQILRMHEEAIRRIKKCLEPIKNTVGSAALALKVIEALNVFHPMHCESWCGWPEGTDK